MLYLVYLKGLPMLLSVPASCHCDRCFYHSPHAVRSTYTSVRLERLLHLPLRPYACARCMFAYASRMRCMQPVYRGSFRTMTFGAYRAFQAWARSTRAERNHFFLLMDSEWGARTKFPPKPNAPEHLRMVHNYIPLNRCSRKSQYPTPRIEQIVQTIMKAGKKIFFCMDAANSYWAIPLRRKDWLLTSFVTPSGQFCYGVMGQGLMGGTHTYSRYRDIVFGYIPKDVDVNGNEIPGFPSVIGDSADGSVAFDGMVDDSYGSATDFDSMFTFLHEKFFPRCAFGPMYLKPSKSFFFFPTLEFLGLEGNTAGLRPSLRKREQISGWPTPQSQEEVEAFLYLTPFLRRFIPGRAEHHRIMTGDKKGPFVWTAEKEQSFLAVKQAIAENAMASVDLKLQYHLAVDASKRATGGVLFQLHEVPAGTQAGPEHRAFERIIMFMSFRLSDAESRYSNSEREALAVVRNLAEV
jgi:hypothetical protein